MSYPPLPDQPHIDKLRDALWTDPLQSRAALMVGSGFSLNARSKSTGLSSFPTWFTLMERLVAELPTRTQDQNSLRSESKSVSGALRLAQEYETLHGRAHLDAFLQRNIPDMNFRPSELHISALQLPWCDVFTTNWDTLLERTALLMVERRYSVVLECRDIAQKLRPRIVKLHGSFPSNRPFVFTEDDFRRYPIELAPFVTLVQQSMMENIVCLIGFSGDDPNFLSWTGWVRDNLRMHQPRIYLAGILNLRPSQRLLLIERGVSPIDLSPILQHIAYMPEPLRYRIALHWFFENLRAGEPPDPINWPDPNPQHLRQNEVISDLPLPPIPEYGGQIPRKEQARAK